MRHAPTSLTCGTVDVDSLPRSDTVHETTYSGVPAGAIVSLAVRADRQVRVACRVGRGRAAGLPAAVGW
ncbi:hypothetical protein [Tsukamurella pseudospumae]|uniref:Uncharacterized protein n=1 Tax=Tsukamurella pseudospumae TaxID=239498 RepID=A0A138AE26_9ACTN|nr:hypothetical protein [Tsukamurella pseudospumae]KXP08704.1 hypothetical protein AXK60_08500 [Tsukamurella pseudospumae]